ncbi:MAG: LytTR family DNA-binding domain-containing protein [Lachnospiraceae bacterium]|nr:LytTR family DNA-binding domain-containing protein [Lachnospiraceae bacterium]
MRLAIIDDELEVRQKLLSFIERFCEEHKKDIKVDMFSSGEELLSRYEEESTYPFDIFLFDIEMDGLNGLETAKKVREKNQTSVILFITNMAQYAVNGYEVEAIDYVLKPVGYIDFSVKLEKALRKADVKKPHHVILHTKDGITNIVTSKLMYVEVLSHDLIYHTKEKDYRLRGRMKDAQEELSSHGFVRIHKSYLVNVGFISTFRLTEIILEDIKLPVGRAYKETAMEAYMKYLRNG